MNTDEILIYQTQERLIQQIARTHSRYEHKNANCRSKFAPVKRNIFIGMNPIPKRIFTPIKAIEKVFYNNQPTYFSVINEENYFAYL